MESRRQNKVARLLQKDLGDILRGFPTHGVMVTVTIVRVSADLGVAKVYLSLFPSDKAEKTHQYLQSKTSEIRGQLGSKVRNQLKKVPELIFYVDDSLDYAERIDQLLKR